MRLPRLGHWERVSTGAMPGEGRDFLRDVIIPGGVAGVVGGTLMILVYMVFSAALGHGFWSAPKMIAGVFWRGGQVEQLGFLAVIVGLIIHYGVSIGLATAFALMLPRYGMTFFAAVPLALLYSMLAYIIMVYFVAAYASPPMRRGLIYPLWFVAHVVWGAWLGLIQPARRVRRHVVVTTTEPVAHREVHV